MEKELRVIISGGGTGGHIFPAVSIANAVKAMRPDAKILFVGALGRMEMQRVPAAGYEIKGLPICGFDRKNLLKNIKVIYKIWKSQRMAKKIIKDFRPQVAVGVGGYASGPTLNKAAAMGIPCLIQEQNSYAGVTNKLLAKKAEKICVAYEGMEVRMPYAASDSTLRKRPSCLWVAVWGLVPSTRACSVISISLRRAVCSLSGRQVNTIAQKSLKG